MSLAISCIEGTTRPQLVSLKQHTFQEKENKGKFLLKICLTQQHTL